MTVLISSQASPDRDHLLGEQKAFSQNFSSIFTSRYIPILLFIAGCVRALVLLMAYPPAHGSDSITYFAYAEGLSGNELFTQIGAIAPPLYPLLILLTYKLLGSVYLLIALQFLMSALVPVLYYLALKPFGAVLALVSALVILGDAQLAIVFNFTSTEPLYVFVSALSVLAFLRRSEAVIDGRWALADATPGVTLALVALTRGVGRYLIIPLAVIFLVRTRSWRRTLTLCAGFGASLLVSSLVSLALVGNSAGVSSGNYMLDGFLFRNPDLVSAENGPNSAMWVEAEQLCYPDDCSTPDSCRIYHAPLQCLESMTGSWDAGISVVSRAAVETVRSHPLAVVERVIDNVSSFLALTGQQYGHDAEPPGQSQCRNIGEMASRLSDTSLMGSLLTDFSEASRPELERVFTRLEGVMCPMLPDNPALRQLVDTIAFRYRSLGRPNPLIWYSAVVIFTLVIPWARRYTMVVLVAMSLLLMHALISAVAFNIQPRYVVVTNPWRAILLTMLIGIVFQVLVSASRMVYSRLKNHRAPT